MIILSFTSYVAQDSVVKVDLNKYSGKWFVIASIPTFFDKEWNFITETYTLKKNGKVDIYTTYIKQNKSKQSSLRSKGFPIKEKNNVEWKIRIAWPFKAPYLIEELTADYSYAVVGHPDKKYLYILSRSSTMEEGLYLSLVARSKAKGYNVSEIRKIPQ